MIEFNLPTNFPTTKKYVLDVINGKQYGDFGKYYNLCKEYLKEYTKTKEIILTHSATAALEMAFQLIGVENKTALMPSYTFSSTANSVLKNNGKIKWVDVEEKDLCINTKELSKLKIKNKVIVPVHYGSSSCNMSEIRNDDLVVEDAAQSLGIFHKEKHVGTFGVFGALSFHNTKFVHAGFGGALLINDLSYFDEALEIFNRGTNRHLFQKGKVNKYNWTSLGSSFGTSDVNFAILYSQLENLELIIKKRKKIYSKYLRDLSPLLKHNIKFQDLTNVSKSNFSSFYLLTKNLNERNKLIKYLNKNGISSQFHYVSLHNSPMGLGIGDKLKLPITESVSNRIVRLPIYPDLKINDVSKIIEKVLFFYGEK